MEGGVSDKTPWEECGYHLMNDRLKKMWKLTRGFEIMDVDNDFFMVKCELFVDREKIVLEDPWMLFDHYLAVVQWTPDFAFHIAEVENTLV